MILEIADIRIPPGKQAEFDAAIQHGIATLIVDRDYRKVLAHTDLAVVMEKGQIVRHGASADLLAEPKALEELLGV